MTDHDPNMPALKREWLAARIMAMLGAILLIAIVAIVTVATLYGSGQQAPAPAPTEIAPSNPPPTAASQAEARRQEDIALCTAALSTAQATAIVPAFAMRDGDISRPAGAQGRYVCDAKTDAAKYAITFDLACTHLGDANCIVLITIAQDGTRILYQRK